MATSAITSGGIYATSQQPLQSVSQHKHGHHSRSMSDIDTQGSSLASPPSATGKTGSKVDVTA
jgi:hypothetical protein